MSTREDYAKALDLVDELEDIAEQYGLLGEGALREFNPHYQSLSDLRSRFLRLLSNVEQNLLHGVKESDL